MEAGHRDLRGRPTITDDGGHPRQPENVPEHPELLQQPQAHLGKKLVFNSDLFQFHFD